MEKAGDLGAPYCLATVGVLLCEISYVFISKSCGLETHFEATFFVLNKVADTPTRVTV